MGKKDDNKANRQYNNQMRRLINILIGIRDRKRGKVRNEFRQNLDAKHPNFIFEADTENDTYKAIGITHEAETFGKKNMPLKRNPKRGKSEPSYIRNGIIETGHKNYGRKKIKNMDFSPEDKPNVKSKIRNYKKERKKKK